MPKDDIEKGKAKPSPRKPTRRKSTPKLSTFEKRNQFKETELVDSYPRVGGKLRLLYEEYPSYGAPNDIDRDIEINSKVIEVGVDHAIVRVKLVVSHGIFYASGSSDASRDASFSTAFTEIAETRALARALRFAGYGAEKAGAEEVPSKERKAKQESVAEISPKELKEIKELIMRIQATTNREGIKAIVKDIKKGKDLKDTQQKYVATIIKKKLLAFSKTGSKPETPPKQANPTRKPQKVSEAVHN